MYLIYICCVCTCMCVCVCVCVYVCVCVCVRVNYNGGADVLDLRSYASILHRNRILF